MTGPELRHLAGRLEAEALNAPDPDRLLELAVQARQRAADREAGPHHPLEHLFHGGDVVLGAGRSAAGATHVQAFYNGGWES